MTTQLDFIALLTLTRTNLYKFGGPILMGTGTVGCILSLAVFTRKNLRKNPCSFYFVAYNVSNFLLIYTSVLFSTLANGYNIQSSSYNLNFCHFSFYTMLLFDVLSPSYLILASVDRILVTSPNALTRRRSTLRLARICVIAVTLFWVLGHSHALVWTTIIQPIPTVSVCTSQPGAYLAFTSYYTIIVKVILIPLSMIILGLCTVKNIQRIGRVAPTHASLSTQPTVNRDMSSTRAKDRQLIRILLLDISIYILFNLLLSGAVMYQQLYQSQSQSFAQTTLQLFLLTIGVFSTFIPICIGGYTNLLVSKTFRHEVKTILCANKLFGVHGRN